MSLDLEKMRDRYRAFVKKRDWEQFHSPKNLAMALTVEASELQEIFQWLTEAQARALPSHPERYQAVKDEMGDVLLYLIRLADVLNIDLNEALWKKFEKVEQKYTLERSAALTRSLKEDVK